MATQSKSAPAAVVLHGVLLDVGGLGVLLAGDSGIGKGELAIELVARGHRLVADDAPEFRCPTPGVVVGRCPAALAGFLEVRGLGILDVAAMYGPTAVSPEVPLGLIVRLEPRSSLAAPAADARLAGQQQRRDVMGVQIPELSLDLMPGRNLAILVEAAVRNHLLRLSGYNAGEALAARQRGMMNRGES